MSKSSSRDICRHWMRGNCVYGHECLFLHPSKEVMGDGVLPEGEDLDVEQALIFQEMKSAPTKGSRKAHVKKGGRAGHFRRWLIDMFGFEMLESGRGVLEIAGGHGEVSFQFENLCDIRSTIIDPRNPGLERSIRKLIHGMYHDKCPEPFKKYLRKDKPIFEEDVKIPLRFLVEWNKSLWRCPEQKNGFTEDDKELDCIIKGCSIVIGLHPDQAVEDIIDFALETNKAFAVLPCCVFPKMFPTREIEGKHVRTYSDLIKYLMAKHPEICMQKLGFEGRNLVLYYKP